MSVAAVLLVASTWLYTGFQWTIRIVVYPQFRSVSRDAFGTYETGHQRKTAMAVGPLFVFFGLSSTFALIARPGIGAGLALGCFLSILVVTGGAAVPLHRRLTAGFNEQVLRRLLAVDSLRLLLAVGACAAAVAYSLG